MANTVERHTATIYQFPVGGRARSTGSPKAKEVLSPLHRSQLATGNFGSSWYHDAAIDEAESLATPKN